MRHDGASPAAAEQVDASLGALGQIIAIEAFVHPHADQVQHLAGQGVIHLHAAEQQHASLQMRGRGQAAVIGQGQKIISQIAVEGHDLVRTELSVAHRGVTVQISFEKRQLWIKKVHFSTHPLSLFKKRM